MGYNAIISRIRTRKLENADFVQVGTVIDKNGTPIATVIVGTDTDDYTLGAYFPPDGQLSEAMCDANNLIGYVDEQGVKHGGYFDHRRRVRAQKFRGVRSEGYWTPLDSLYWTGVYREELTEGLQFTELNGKPVCNKYFNEVTANTRGQGKGKNKQRGETVFFPKHMDTLQLDYYLGDIPPGSFIEITEKVHGTSGRLAHCLDAVELPRWQQWINKFYPIFPSRAYSYLNGTRNVILEHSSGGGWYGSDQFRYDAVQGISLHKGEVIYFELVGWVDDARPIMEPHDVSILKDKVLARQYPKIMYYNYGTLPGQCKLFVYRITQINEDGNDAELSSFAMRKRAKELGLQVVPVIDRFVYDGDANKLQRLVEVYLEGPSILDNNHIREGVIIRVESEQGTQFLKKKSWTFKVCEGIVKDNSTVIDMEEVS